ADHPPIPNKFVGNGGFLMCMVKSELSNCKKEGQLGNRRVRHEAYVIMRRSNQWLSTFAKQQHQTGEL
ncbi:hypothetical protein KY382_32725, partial [Pseudomonas monteilii]|nr:hypothetical protein [Pseudomonas monteilii]